jgi:hypothetical protein
MITNTHLIRVCLCFDIKNQISFHSLLSYSYNKRLKIHTWYIKICFIQMTNVDIKQMICDGKSSDHVI